jgi:hypothetical protein
MIAFAFTAFGGTALAAEGDPVLQTKYGMSASIGGGVVGFTEKNLTDMTDPGGSWTARVTFGTRMYVAAELAYVGTAQNIETFGMDPSAALISNGVEGAVRLNLVDEGIWQPYAFVGLAWRRYNLVNEDFNTSSVEDEDDVGEVPFGAGLAFRYSGFVADARFEFRPAFNSDLLALGGNDTQLHAWSANGRIGWEF